MKILKDLETNENKMSKLITNAKILSAERVNKLEKADIEEMLNIDNEAPIVHSLSDGEIAEMVLSTDQYEDSSNSDDGGDLMSICEKISVGHVVKMCDQLMAGLDK